MHITEVHVRDILGLEAIDAQLAQGLVSIQGPNECGKSSLLASTQAGLLGPTSLPALADPLREGSDRGEIDLTLGDGEVETLTIHRTIRRTEGGRIDWRLRLTRADGGHVRRPQEVLSALTARMADPLAFERMKAGEQVLCALDAAGCRESWEHVQAQREKAYDERTEANRTLRELTARRQGIETDAHAGTEEVDVEALIAKRQGVEAHNRAVWDAKQDVEQRRGRIDMLEQKRAEKRRQLKLRYADLEQQIERLEAELRAARQSREQLVASGRESDEADGAEIEAAREELNERMLHVAEVQPADELDTAIASATRINAAVDRNRQARELDRQIARKREAAAALTKRMEGIDRQAGELLAGSELAARVKGLGITEAGLTWKGLPLANASGSRRFLVAIVLAMAQRPELKTIFIDNGEALDAERLGMLERVATEYGWQIIQARVAEGSCLEIHGGELIAQGQTA